LHTGYSGRERRIWRRKRGRRRRRRRRVKDLSNGMLLSATDVMVDLLGSLRVVWKSRRNRCVAQLGRLRVRGERLLQRVLPPLVVAATRLGERETAGIERERAEQVMRSRKRMRMKTERGYTGSGLRERGEMEVKEKRKGVRWGGQKVSMPPLAERRKLTGGSSGMMTVRTPPTSGSRVRQGQTGEPHVGSLLVRMGHVARRRWRRKMGKTLGGHRLHTGYSGRERRIWRRKRGRRRRRRMKDLSNGMLLSATDVMVCLLGSLRVVWKSRRSLCVAQLGRLRVRGERLLQRVSPPLVVAATRLGEQVALCLEREKARPRWMGRSKPGRAGASMGNLDTSRLWQCELVPQLTLVWVRTRRRMARNKLRRSGVRRGWLLEQQTVCAAGLWGPLHLVRQGSSRVVGRKQRMGK
jgi:hypothetical protein